MAQDLDLQFTLLYEAIKQVAESSTLDTFNKDENIQSILELNSTLKNAEKEERQQKLKDNNLNYQNAIYLLLYYSIKDENIKKIINTNIFGAALVVMNTFYNESQKLYQCAKNQNSKLQDDTATFIEKYLTFAQHRITQVTQLFLYLLEQDEKKQQEHADFYGLVKNILKALDEYGKDASNRRRIDAAYELRHNVINIAYDLYQNKTQENTATRALLLCVRTEQLLAKADSRRGHSRYANMLAKATTGFSRIIQEGGQPVDPFAELVKTIEKAISDYQRVQQQRIRSSQNMNRKQSYQSIWSKMDLLESERYHHTPREQLAQELKLFVEKEIAKIKEEHKQQSLFGQLGLTESVLARKLEAITKVFPSLKLPTNTTESKETLPLCSTEPLPRKKILENNKITIKDAKHKLDDMSQLAKMLREEKEEKIKTKTMKTEAEKFQNDVRGWIKEKREKAINDIKESKNNSSSKVVGASLKLMH